MTSIPGRRSLAVFVLAAALGCDSEAPPASTAAPPTSAPASAPASHPEKRTRVRAVVAGPGGHRVVEDRWITEKERSEMWAERRQAMERGQGGPAATQPAGGGGVEGVSRAVTNRHVCTASSFWMCCDPGISEGCDFLWCFDNDGGVDAPLPYTFDREEICGVDGSVKSYWAGSRTAELCSTNAASCNPTTPVNFWGVVQKRVCAWEQNDNWPSAAFSTTALTVNTSQSTCPW
jgi:hypothetical protein